MAGSCCSRAIERWRSRIAARPPTKAAASSSRGLRFLVSWRQRNEKRTMLNLRRRFNADHRDRDFSPAMERVDLHGRLRTAAWPPLCANCCAPATSRLVVKKIFRRQPGGRYLGHGWKYVIRSARIPYCPSCMARNADIVAAERMPFLELIVRLVAT